MNIHTPQNVPVPVPAVLPPATFKIRIDNTTGVHIDEHDYVKHRKTDKGYLLRRLDMPDVIEEFSFEELARLYDDERLSVTHDYHSSRSASGRLNSNDTYLSDLGPVRQGTWSERLDMVEDFLRAESDGEYTRSDSSLGKFIDAWFAARVQSMKGRFGTKFDMGSPPHASTLRRWLQRYENCEFDPNALVDGYGRSGNRYPRLAPEAAALMFEWAETYKSDLKPSMRSVYRDMRADFRTRKPHLSVPGRSTFERAIKTLDPFHVLAAREGEAVARKKLYAVRDRVDVTRPLQRVEMDEQMIPLQAMLVERGLWEKLPEKLKAGITHDRFWCSKIIDVYSRVVLGFVITPNPSAASALATLRMALMDKTGLSSALGCLSPWDMFGLPELIVTDSGSNFRSKQVRAAVLDLGSSIMIAPAGLPQMRGVVERSFRTDTQLFYSKIPGRTFKDPVEKGEYESEKNIVLTITELANMMVRYFVDVYHNTPHTGLGGDTPLNRWRTGVERFGVVPPPSRDVMRHIFSTAIQCRIGNRGVRAAGLYFQSKALQHARRSVRSKPVLVRVDTDDLGHVSVKTDEGWLTVPCSTPGFDGVSIEGWRLTQEDLRRRYANVARLSEDIVNRALVEMREQIDRLRVESNVPSSIMSSESFVRFDRDLARGFDMVRPENGDVATIPDTEDYAAQVVDEESLAAETTISTGLVANATFFTE
jgi:putative transposase